MICLIAGTNRPQSQTLRVTRLLEKRYKALGVATQVLDLNGLPPDIFLPNAYAEKPRSFEPYSEAVLKADGLVIVTPEYNGSFPGVLKLFIDMLKFPESFEKKPVAFVGLAAGMWGALRSVEQLEGIFKYRNAFLFNERVFLPRVETQLGADDTFTQALTSQLVDSQVKNFTSFVEQVKKLHG
jgi:chromate reductase, NAD(P)H dehydrogenase (quinone)